MDPLPAELDLLPMAVMVVRDGLVRQVNRACLRLLEADVAQQVLGQSVERFLHPQDADLARQRREESARPEHFGLPMQSTAFRVQTCQGRIRIVLVSSVATVWQGAPAVVINGVDMTHLDELQHQLRESEHNFRRLFEKMQDVYYRTDAQGVVQHVGPGVIRVLGYQPHEIEGRTAESYYPQSADRDAFKAAIMAHGEVSDFPGQMVRRDGRVIDISISSHALYDHNGAFAGVEGIYRDVTQRKNLERELQRLARTDQLTGLSNRRALLELGESLFLASRQRNSPLALLMLDLDHFKSINDRFGHLEGDRALVALAQVLRSELRASDVVGRLGGEEFAMILPDTQPEEAAQVAERIVQQLRRTVLWVREGDSAPPRALTASIGLANRSAADEHPQQLLERADRALYQAKQAGRDRWVQAPDPRPAAQGADAASATAGPRP